MAKTMVAVLGVLVLGGCAMDAATDEDIMLAEEGLDSPGRFDPTDPMLDPGGDPPPGWEPDNVVARGVDPCPECRFLYIPRAGTADRVNSYRVYVDLGQAMSAMGVDQVRIRACTSDSCTFVPLPILNTTSVPSYRPQFVYPGTSLYDRDVSDHSFFVRYECASDSNGVDWPCADDRTMTAADGSRYAEYPVPYRTQESAQSRWIAPTGSGAYDPAAIIIWLPPRIIFSGI